MSDMKTDTGSPELDEDLRLLFEVCEGKRLRRLREGLAKETLSKQEFSNLLPDGALRLAYALCDELQYRMIVEDIGEGARSLVERARDLAKRHLTRVLKHPLTKDRLKKILSQIAKREDHPLQNNLKVISAIAPIYTWVGDPPGLTPAVRLGFLNRRNELLLDSMLDWDDLLFVTKALMEVLVDHLEKGQELAKTKQLDLGNTKRLANHISQIEKYLLETKRLAATYGIKLNAKESEKASEKNNGST